MSKVGVTFRYIRGRVIPIFKKGNLNIVAKPKIQKLAQEVDELKFYKSDWGSLSGPARDILLPPKRDILATLNELNKKRKKLGKIIGHEVRKLGRKK